MDHPGSATPPPPVGAADIERLAGWWLKHNVAPGLLRRFYPELYSAALLGIARAVRYFDPARGAFSTFVTKPMRWAVKRELVLLRRQASRRTVSLTNGAGGSIDVIDDNAGQPVADLLAAEQAAGLEGRLSALPAKVRAVLEARLAGETFASIGERLGVTRQRACQLEQRARRLLGVVQ